MLHEAEKILGCVTVRAPVGDLTTRNVQRCVQVDDAVTLVVVRVASGASFAKRQRKLRTLERLNLRLLVDAQHDRVSHFRASGRTSHELTLFPWRPVIDRQLGREVMGVVQGGSVAWQLGRQSG
jgi:hypothetical protein